MKISNARYCNRWLDDAPGIRADCERHLERGLPCVECQHRDIRLELRDYRKAVREYFSAVDARRNADSWEVGKDRWRELADIHIAAEANLRALQESDDET